MNRPRTRVILASRYSANAIADSGKNSAEIARIVKPRSKTGIIIRQR